MKMQDKKQPLAADLRLKGMRIFIAFAFAAILLPFSCKNDPETVPGGNVRLLVSVSHHGIPIANAVLFRKNGTTVFPGQDTTLYDQRYVTDAQGQFTIDNLGSGEHRMVIYAKGIDPSWDSTQQTPVWGYQFTSFSTVIGESRDVSMTIPVSE